LKSLILSELLLKALTIGSLNVEDLFKVLELSLKNFIVGCFPVDLVDSDPLGDVLDTSNLN
jgi:hypothetical protein